MDSRRITGDRESWKRMLTGLGYVGICAGILGVFVVGSSENGTSDQLMQAVLVGVGGAGALVVSKRMDATDSAEQSKECPFCAEVVNLRAAKCKHCGSDLTSSEKPESRQESELRSTIASLKDELRLAGPPRAPGRLIALGRSYARLFDETGDPQNRASALKYMHAALEADPQYLDGSAANREPFGSLMEDAEFRPFL